MNTSGWLPSNFLVYERRVGTGTRAVTIRAAWLLTGTQNTIQQNAKGQKRTH